MVTGAARIGHDSCQNRSRDLVKSVTRAARIGHGSCQESVTGAGKNQSRELRESITRAARIDHESCENRSRDLVKSVTRAARIGHGSWQESVTGAGNFCRLWVAIFCHPIAALVGPPAKLWHAKSRRSNEKRRFSCSDGVQWQSLRPLVAPPARLRAGILWRLLAS